MTQVVGVHLLPASGEFVYDTIPFSGAQRGAAGLNPYTPTNTFFAPGGSKTDYSYAIDQLQAQHPECTTVSLVCAWFFDSEDASACQIYPSTNYLLGGFEQFVGGSPVADHWRVSGLTEQDYPGIIPLPAMPGTTNFVYGGTPSDPSIVRCIQDLKGRGFRVVFYPFLLGTAAGFPWRGRITYAPDTTAAATSAVNAFLGSAAPSMFTRDTVNLTVGYSGAQFDWSYRRMILHYANLCVIAGGVDLFVIGSELRGLEIIRGPAWTKAGTIDSLGYAVWDYPFVAGLIALADDVRAVFDAAGLTKNLPTLKNLITYSADWSSWMGWQHPGEERAMAASRPALGPPEHRPRRLRQLPAPVGLDDRRRRPRCHKLDLAGAARSVAAVAGDDEWPRPVWRSVRLFDPLSQGQHRRRRSLQLVLQRRNERRPRPRPDRFSPHGVPAAR